MAKIGRPKVPKREAKAVLIGARFSPVESKGIENAMAESGQDKSKWLREAVREKIQKQETIRFIDQLCKDLKSDEWPNEFEAILTAAPLPPSTGKFSLDSKLGGQGHFQPIGTDNVGKYPLHGARLTLSGILEQLLVTNISRCATCSVPSYHIWFEVVPE